MSLRSLRRSLFVALSLALVGPMPVAGAVPPPNDAFASATVVGPLPYQDTVSTLEATLQAGEPQPPCAFDELGRTVWYSFTPASDTFVAADTLGSNFDTVVGVWTGPDLTGLESIACSDDALTFGATVVFRAQAAVTYYIQVGGLFGEAGSLLFRMREVEAGLIEGTVTQEGTGSPLAGMCVETFDRDIISAQFTVTGSDGSYEFAVRAGSYLVAFIDFCDASDDHIAELYDDVPFSQPESATPVDVSVSSVVSGIDAELSLGCPGFATLGALSGLTQVVGTPGPDVLTGTSGDDLLCGLNGADTLRGLGGSDVLLGAGGRDRLVAGAGDNHLLDGGAGRDRLVGGPGLDFLFGGPGKDRLLGRGHPDILSGGSGNDRLFGGAGDDGLDGGRGWDRCVGGPGRDFAFRCEVVKGVDPFDDDRFGGPGRDRCVGGPRRDRAFRCEVVKGVERVFGFQLAAPALLRGEDVSRRDLLEAALAPLRD